MVNRFPFDRVNNFSDAIFAIAITLLILDVKIPPSADIEALGTGEALAKQIPSIIGLLVSFFVTALYWRAHLTLVQFIKSYDNRMLWLNLWLLLFVVLLPFSTALYSKNFNLNGPFVFYCFNLVMIGFFNYLMVKHTLFKEGYSETLTPLVGAWLKFRATVAPTVWLFSALMAFIEPVTARFTFILIFIILMIGDRNYKRKAKELELKEQASQA